MGRCEHKQGFKDDMIKTLSAVTKLLNENKIQYCISWGTLLGYVRDNDIIDGDDDLDFYIDSESSETVKNLLTKNNFYRNHIPSPISNPYNIIQFRKKCKNGEVPVDFYPYKNTNEDYVVDYYNSAPYHLKTSIEKTIEDKRDLRIPKNYLFPLRSAIFKNFEIKIPNNPIAFLEWQYSTDFTTKLTEAKDYHREAMDNRPVYIMKK